LEGNVEVVSEAESVVDVDVDVVVSSVEVIADKVEFTLFCNNTESEVESVLDVVVTVARSEEVDVAVSEDDEVEIREESVGIACDTESLKVVEVGGTLESLSTVGVDVDVDVACVGFEAVVAPT